MKRAKRIYALLGGLAVASVATVLVLNHQEQQEQIRNSGEVVLEVEPDSVQSLSWEYESETLAFHKEEGWLYDDDTAFPVDEEKINELLEQFQEFSAAFIIEEVTDYSQYGLDDPVCTIQLSTDEQDYEIKLGNYSAMDSQRYVSIGDGNVYLAVSDPLDYFDAQLSDVILNDETPDFDTVESIQFQGEDSYQVTYQEYTEDSPYTYCADDVYFRQDGEDLHGASRQRDPSPGGNCLLPVRWRTVSGRCKWSVCVFGTPVQCSGLGGSHQCHRSLISKKREVIFRIASRFLSPAAPAAAEKVL